MQDQQLAVLKVPLTSPLKKKKILFIFRERGRERERKGEKHQCVVA